jgi:hypothetical protein
MFEEGESNSRGKTGSSEARTWFQIESIPTSVLFLQDKVRNFFTLEPFNEESVLRSRKCLFAVTEEEDLERRQREAEEDGKTLQLDLHYFLLWAYYWISVLMRE